MMQVADEVYWPKQHMVDGKLAQLPPLLRRVVLLADGPDSEVAEVLAEFHAQEAGKPNVHTELRPLGAAHAGRMVAGEWLHPGGAWVRFLWYRLGDT